MVNGDDGTTDKIYDHNDEDDGDYGYDDDDNPLYPSVIDIGSEFISSLNSVYQFLWNWWTLSVSSKDIISVYPTGKWKLMEIIEENSLKLFKIIFSLSLHIENSCILMSI